MSLFDLNFYSGDIHGQASSSWVEFIKTIGAAGFGIAITKGLEYLNDKKKVRKAGETIINEVYLLEEPLATQIASLNELVRLLKEKKIKTPLLELNFKLDTSRIKGINRNDVIRAFERRIGKSKDAIDKANSIYTSLEVITYNISRMQVLFDEFLEKGENELLRCKSNTDRIVHKLADLSVQYERQRGKIDSDLFLKKVHELVNEHLIKPNNEGKQVDFLDLKDNFFKPLSELLYEHRLDLRAGTLSEFTYQCKEGIRELLYLNIVMAFKFGKIAESLSQQKNKLLSYANDISKLKY